MFIALLTLILTYYGSAVVQTLAHRAFGHARRILPIYASHTLGHHAQYARNALLQDQWIRTERHVLWYYAFPFTAIAAALGLAAGWLVLASYLAGLAFSVWVHVKLHREYHIRGSTLERYQWFLRKRSLHFVHHRQVRRNYAIVEYWIDRVLGTYRAP